MCGAAFCGKMVADGLRWQPFFPQKAAPHTSLSHYNTKYQITRNSRIMKYTYMYSLYYNSTWTINISSHNVKFSAQENVYLLGHIWFLLGYADLIPYHFNTLVIVHGKKRWINSRHISLMNLQQITRRILASWLSDIHMQTFLKIKILVDKIWQGPLHMSKLCYTHWTWSKCNQKNCI